MKINLLQAIVNAIDDVTTLTGGALLYSPELDLNAQTKPFAVVRSLTDMEKITTFDAAKEAEYYIWVYVYPIPNEYQAISLPEDIKSTLFSELTVTIGTAPYGYTSNVLRVEVYGQSIFGENIFGERTEEEKNQKIYKSKPLDITVNRLNGMDNDLEKYGSVITCIYKIYS